MAKALSPRAASYLLLALGAGCRANSTPGAAAPAADETARTEDLVHAVQRDRNAPLIHACSRGSNTRTAWALWDNGLMLWSTNAEHCGPPYACGRLDPADARSLLDQLVVDFVRLPRPCRRSGVVDGGWNEITLRLGTNQLCMESDRLGFVPDPLALAFESAGDLTCTGTWNRGIARLACAQPKHGGTCEGLLALEAGYGTIAGTEFVNSCVVSGSVTRP